MAKMTKAEAEINETAWNYMLRCEEYEKRIAELEQALSEIERNAGKCVTLEQANWTIHKIKERSAAALGK